LERQAIKLPNLGGGVDDYEIEKKGEASQERSPLLHESVGGRLIGVLYCRPRKKSFHFFAGMMPRKKKRKNNSYTLQPRVLATSEGSHFGSRLRQLCFVSPSYRGRGMRLTEGQR
jgi:hypothetical protein